MSHASLAVYTTVYPGVEKYLNEWYGSVLRQSDQDFDLWIGLDGLAIDHACSAMGVAPDAQWVVSDTRRTPASVRQRALELLVDRYRTIVFVDSDDLLDSTRIGAARNGLAEYDVVACALRLVDEQGRTLGPMFAPDPGENLGQLLLAHNVFGLSNSAYRSEVVRRCLPLPSDCELVDWLLVTRAWLSGATLSFDRTPRMYYRRYEANVTPLTQPFTASDVLVSANRVLRHYHHLLHSEWKIPEDRRTCFEQNHARAARFEAVMRESPALLDRYVRALNAQPPRHVWWWCVAHSALEHLWQT